MTTGRKTFGALTCEDLREELVRFAHGELRKVLEEVVPAMPHDLDGTSRYSAPMTPRDGSNATITPKPWQPFARKPDWSTAQYSEHMTSSIDDLDHSEDYNEEIVKQSETGVGFRRHDWFEASYPTRLEGPKQHLEEDSEGTAPMLHKQSRKSFRRCSGSNLNHHEDAEDYFSHLHRHKALLAEEKRFELRASGSQRIVKHRYFELLMATLVVLNAGLIGFEANRVQHLGLSADHAEAAETEFTMGLDFLFALFFTIELLLRISADGWGIFKVDGWRWNLFDAVILFFQWMYQTLRFFPSLKMPVKIAVVRVLRFARIVRIFRLVRFLSELELIVKSITVTVTGVAWALLLLVVIVYVCSVLFLQVVSMRHTTALHPHVKRWFGGIFRTMLTFTEVTFGGVDWDEVIGPRATDVSPVLGVVFVLYVTISILALLNLVTGLFVERVTQTMHEGRDSNFARRICQLFVKDLDADHELTWDEFTEKMGSSTMRDFFRAIEVDPCDAKDFFVLMDTNNSGSVSAEEMVNGCLRLRGPAKSLDMAILFRAVDNIESTLLELVGTSSRSTTIARCKQ